MKKLLFATLFSLLSVTLLAVPASPYPFEVIQPDGSAIMVKLVGDEYYAYYTTVDGTPLRRLDNGFFVEDYTVKEQAGQVATQRRAAALRPRANATNFPLKGTPRSLVLLVNFKDKAFTEKLEDFDNLLNQKGYSYNGATGSCRDYFIAASDSAFQPYFDVFGPFTLSKDMNYYGEEKGDRHDNAPADMIIEACQLAAESGVDFANYDLDGDNILDNVFVYYAGHNQAEGASSNTIWPHKNDLSSRNVSVDGKRLATYACTSEYSKSSGTRRASIGTFCHEFGHVLGLPDLYDTGDGTNLNYTVANWDIMCSGNYNNDGNTPPTYSAYARFFLGWLKPQQLLAKGQYFLQPLQESNVAYLFATENHNMIGNSPSPNEFFIYEYRTQTGWDTYLPGQGMLVWHIDYSAQAWAFNTPNNGKDFLRVHLEEANGIPWSQRKNGDGGKASDPYPGTQKVTTFTPKLHNGTVLPDHTIFEISETEGIVSFIYQGLGDVQMTTDVSELSITTTVSDNKKIVDWEPQSLVLTASGLESDTITFVTKGSFSVAVGAECPKRNSDAWSRNLQYVVPQDVTDHTVWVNFIPNKQSCDAVNGSMTISTVGATIPVVLRGYAPRPTYITTPKIKPVTSVTPFSFRLEWEPVSDAVLYYVTLYQVSDGEATYTQDFEQFDSYEAIKNQGWDANVNRTTSAAKADGSKSLFFQKTGEYIVSEEYLSPIQSISFWVNAFFSDSVTAGYLDLDAWDGEKWIELSEYRTTVLSTTKKKTIDIDLGADNNYTKVRLSYTDVGGAGLALDAFKATCTRNVSYIYRGKDLSLDAYSDEASCVYEMTGLKSGATYYCSMQSSDITKGCEEHISPLSEPIEVQTVLVQESDDKKDEYRLPIAVDYANYGQPTPVVYISNPTIGGVLNVYDLQGALVYSMPTYNGVVEYVIPANSLQTGTLYLVKYIEGGKMKRKQGWAKFVL